MGTEAKDEDYDALLFNKVWTFFREKQFQNQINDVDEMCPNVYVGNGDFARDLKELKSKRITHVLNMAPKMTETNADYYKALKIKFHSFDADDDRDFNLKQFFQETSNCIENALQENGKVLVHCAAGYSRAPTVFIAYLMIKQKYNLWDAAEMARSKRNIFPNTGFLKQLCTLEKELYS